MGLIVVTRVLKYKTFIFAVILVLSLAFFQSNQSLDETSEARGSSENNSEVSNTTETPSIPEIPTPPDKVVRDDEGVFKTSISISVKTNTNTLANIDGDLESGETTVTIIEREITSGSIKLSFKSSGGDFKIKEKIENEEGKTSVKFSSKSNHTTKNEYSREISIDLGD